MRRWKTLFVRYAADVFWLGQSRWPRRRRLGTAFTYQGRLDQNSQPVNGNVDLGLPALRRADRRGRAGHADAQRHAPVTDGLFTVILNSARSNLARNAFDGHSAGWRLRSRHAAGTPPATYLRPVRSLRPVQRRALATSGDNINNTNTGNVAIGKDLPSAKLDVLTDGIFAIQGQSSGAVWGSTD